MKNLFMNLESENLSKSIELKSEYRILKKESMSMIKGGGQNKGGVIFD